MDLKSIRKAAGITQHELATLVGVKQPLVSKIEKRSANPSTEVAKRIAKVLNLSISEMWEMFFEDENRCR